MCSVTLQRGKVMSDNTIQDRINQELESARNACDSSGSNSEECAAAWDAVEELQAEASHQREKGSGESQVFFRAILRQQSRC